MTTQTVRAIHIDPFAKTVTEIDMPNDFKRMKTELLKCSLAEAMDLGLGVTAWMDEEGTCMDWKAQGWTRLAGHLFLAGHIILTGPEPEHDGDNTLAFMPMPEDGPDLAETQSLVEFVSFDKVRLPGQSMTTFDADGRPETSWSGPRWRTHQTG